jgi:hypothetical protein
MSGYDLTKNIFLSGYNPTKNKFMKEYNPTLFCDIALRTSHHAESMVDGPGI